MQVPFELDVKTVKKLHSEVEDTEVEAQGEKIKSEWKNLTEKKWKKSLFQNEVEDYEPIAESGIEQLRFSPKIGKAKVKVPSKSKVLLSMAEDRPGTKRLNFNHKQHGREAATKYEEFCAMVCAENFETCLQEMPHIDPLTRVKQSLISYYTETCNQRALRNRVGRGELFAEESSSTNSCLVHFNVRENKYFDQGGSLERSKSERVNVLPPQGVCLSNLKNFRHQKALETSSARSKPPMMEAPEVNKSKNIPRVARGPPSSVTSIIERNTSSLEVNYDSSGKNSDLDVRESLKIDDGVGPSVVEANKTTSQRLAGIPSHRKKTMLRYLKEVNNFEPEMDGSIGPVKLSATSAENNNFRKYYIGDPLRRHEMQMKRSRNFDEIRHPPPSQTSVIEQSRNSLDADCDNAKTCLGSEPGNFPKIDAEARRMVVNLGSASRSTLARIPSDQGEFMLRYLQDVNNSEPRKEDAATFRPEVFVVLRKNTELQERHPGEPLRKHDVKDPSVDRLGKSGRHVPAILRKSQASKVKKKSNTSGTILAKGASEIKKFRWKTCDFKFQKLSSGSDTTPANSISDKMQLPTTESLFTIESGDSTNREHSNLAKNISRTLKFPKHQASVPQTPIVVNALHDLNEKALKIKRNFMDELFACKSEIRGQCNVAETSGNLNLSVEFKWLSPEICPRQNYTDKNTTLPNLQNNRQSLNSPIFLHKQGSDATRAHGVVCDKNRMASLGNYESQRFPVFLKRKAVSSTQNRIPYEEQHQARLLPQKVVTLQNPTLRGIGEDLMREMDIQEYRSMLDNNLQSRDAGLGLPKYPRAVQSGSLKQVQLQNGRQTIQQFQAPDLSRHNVGQQVEQLQVPRCVYENDLPNNREHVRLPSIVYQTGVRRAAEHKYTVEELRNNSINLFETTTLDVPTSQGIFQPDLWSNCEIPATYASSYFANPNLESMHNCSSAESIQLSDKQIDFVLPKNNPKPFCQNASDLPTINRRMPRRQNHCPVPAGDRNQSYKYIVDPRYPQAGHQWDQVDQNGAQIHQRIIQPAYNVTDAYRPQVPHSYFSNDS